MVSRPSRESSRMIKDLNDRMEIFYVVIEKILYNSIWVLVRYGLLSRIVGDIVLRKFTS
jgi:hypothetical protein